MMKREKTEGTGESEGGFSDPELADFYSGFKHVFNRYPSIEEIWVEARRRELIRIGIAVDVLVDKMKNEV